MNVNPVLAQFVRGNWVENIHRGALCVSTDAGEIVASVGDIDRPVFPRSAIKAMQALPIFETGAGEQFGYGDAAIALACASHNGEPEHAGLAQTMLEAADLSEADLECGAHPPIDPAARKALFATGGRPGALHNACSGKHAGMLSVARALGVDTKGYSTRDHEVQRRVRAAVELIIGHPLTEDKCGTDGCSIPTWAAPIKSFAAGFARMATGTGLPDATALAARQIFDGATSHPFLVGGTGSFDTLAMEAFDGRLMLKFGADGVYCGALRDKGLGFALKCDDGNVAAATAMIARFLLSVGEPDHQQAALLERFAKKTVSNWAGHEVGFMEGTDATALSV